MVWNRSVHDIYCFCLYSGKKASLFGHLAQWWLHLSAIILRNFSGNICELKWNGNGIGLFVRELSLLEWLITCMKEHWKWKEKWCQKENQKKLEWQQLKDKRKYKEVSKWKDKKNVCNLWSLKQVDWLKYNWKSENLDLLKEIFKKFRNF